MATKKSPTTDVTITTAERAAFGILKLALEEAAIAHKEAQIAVALAEVVVKRAEMAAVAKANAISEAHGIDPNNTAEKWNFDGSVFKKADPS